MRFTLLLFICTVIGCKAQEKGVQTSEFVAVVDYIPSPNEVVLNLQFVDSKKSGDYWDNNVKILRQLKSGFGHKNRLKPGRIISLNSKEEIPRGDFFCVAKYQIDPNGGSYTLKSLLQK